ncbi:hypothetical protein [Peribacillus asahii]|uniref:hypothetical protein n=1 Tax=Peribacillus asahii TaxID=228899 RepID=UPI00207A6697|nr:hypothetical protein [Peribacillus asahii]USK71748.1 hypothetical protein LIS76_08345 [Peribacillus asahii]
MRIVNDVKEMPEAKVFWGVFDENGYTGNAEEYPGASNEVKRIISDGYKPRYFKTYNNFPRNFVPKKDTPYLCNAKVTKQWQQGRTNFTRVSLNNPVELLTDIPKIESNNQTVYLSGLTAKSDWGYFEGRITNGYISVDNKLYLHENSHSYNVLGLAYHLRRNVFYTRADLFDDCEDAALEYGPIFDSLGSTEETQKYIDLHFYLRELIKKKLDSNTKKISNDEIQQMIPSIFEVRDPEIVEISKSKPLTATEWNYVVRLWFEVRRSNGEWFPIIKELSFPESSFNDHAKKYIHMVLI